jgi:hypothetical protein
MRFIVTLALLSVGLAARDPTDCEVCVKVLNEVAGRVKDKKDLIHIEETLGNYCEKNKALNEKEVKLCYYIDPIKREVSQPMKNGVPPEKICERLKKKSAEICALRYSAMAAPKVSNSTIHHMPPTLVGYE